MLDSCHGLPAAKNLVNATAMQPCSPADLSEREPCVARTFKALSSCLLCLLKLTLGTFDLGLSTAHLAENLSLGVLWHDRRLFAGSADTFRR